MPQDATCPNAETHHERLRVDETQRDLDGYLYRITEDDSIAWRVSACCHAAVTYCEFTLCCKCCYAEVDPDTDQPARLDPRQPIERHGPFVVFLHTSDESEV